MAILIMIKKSLVFITSIFLLLGLINFASANGANGSPSPTEPICGDGIVYANMGEQCDDGSLNGQPNKCNLQCSGITASVCGNKVMEAGEFCDDGNDIDDDFCNNECLINQQEPQNAAPVCSVDSMENDDTNKQFVFNNEKTYINENGKFILRGSASDEDSNIVNVQYTRSDQNPFLKNGIPFTGAFDSKNEQWKSDPVDPGFNDGNNEVCCSATDSNGLTGEFSCQEFCIDTLEPNPVTNLMPQINDCSQDGHYSNKECVVWTWSPAIDEGCSNIKDYNVELFDSHGISIDSDTTTDTLIEFCGLADEESYHVLVTPIDNAGNEGNDATSENVIVDLKKPEVTITTNASMWYTNDFNVEEIDSDENDIICEYKIINPDGVTTIDWTEIKCNTPITVDVSEDCPVDGSNDCKVYKRVTDTACNVGDTSKQFDLDRVAPVTTKTVGEPKYTGFLWMDAVVDWFITDKTQISFECADAISGCAEIKYRIIPPGNDEEDEEISFVVYDGAFALGDVDGLYTVEYFSVDNAGNEEVHKFEIDKVDTEAPKTTKTIGEPQFMDDDERLWVSNLTEFMLTCADEEVGCMTSFVSFDDKSSFAINEDGKFTLQGLQDGEHTVNFWSIDKLDNEEMPHQTEVDWLDSSPPLLIGLNPNELEAGNVQACYQSIVAFVGDSQSGVKKVWAELYDSNKELLRIVNMTLQNDGLYEALMDKQLPVGSYDLIVYAEDNVGNIDAWHSSESLVGGVFVEYLSPATCSVNTELGGSCKFTYHVCMRGANSVEFWMDKMGVPGVPPGLLNASVSKGEDYANVGLLIDGESNFVSPLEPSRLQLDEDLINGKTTFDLNLHIPADIASQIGAGAHKLTYIIDSFDDIILPICGNNIIENTEQCDDGSLNGHPNKCNLTCTGITASICGNDELEAGEQCDDNNILDGDGCSSTCQIESLPQ